MLVDSIEKRVESIQEWDENLVKQTFLMMLSLFGIVLIPKVGRQLTIFSGNDLFAEESWL